MTTTLSTHKARPAGVPASAKIIDRLFGRLIAFYGTKFTDAFAGVELDTLKEVWGEELAGYSLDEMGAGVRACRQLKWPPTLPEFLNFCRPPLAPEAAYYEAITNSAERSNGRAPNYTHPAVFWAAQEIGWWDMKHTAYRMIAARWAECLQRHLARGDWEPVPAPPMQIAPPVTHGPTPEQRAALQALRANSIKSALRAIEPEEQSS